MVRRHLLHLNPPITSPCAAQYALSLQFEQNIWYDTLTVLAQLLQANPSSSNLQKDWSNILQSIDLSNIIQKPIVKIYQ